MSIANEEFEAVTKELARRFTKFRSTDAWSAANREAFATYSASFIGQSIDVNINERSEVVSVAVTSDMVTAAKSRMVGGEFKLEVR